MDSGAPIGSKRRVARWPEQARDRAPDHGPGPFRRTPDDGFGFRAGPLPWPARMSIAAIALQPRAVAGGAKPFMSEFLKALLSGPLPRGTAMSSELIKEVTDQSFDAEVLKSETPVLVDYWAEWCGPCKMIAPILDETAKEFNGRLQIAKLNVDDNRDVPAKYGIRGIPTLMLFKGGQLAATKVGALSKAQLTAFLQPHL
jgi:thioredoxin 1